VTELIEEKRKGMKKIKDYIENKEYISYGVYTKFRGGI